MADETQGQLPTPDPALRRLDRFVGTWSMEGHLVGSDETTVTGETTFRWLPGGFFLEQRAGMNFMGLQIESLELIGYDPETGTFPSTVFSNLSPTPLPYRWEVDDDTLKISVSYGPLDATFSGTFDEDGDGFRGGWRPNPGADESINVPYDIGGRRKAQRHGRRVAPGRGRWSTGAAHRDGDPEWRPPIAYVSRGFHGKRAKEREDARLPAGQYLTEDFPVLSAGPTPYTSLADWSFTIETEAGQELERWSWDAFRALPSEEVRVDIHCVTKWTKLDTVWEGVAIDTLLEGIDHDATHAMAFSDGDYLTNVPLGDLVDGKAWVAFGYDGSPLEPEHGGPARLLVPHLYFWKSAKWVRGLRLMDHDEAGFWESYGYHIYGDPWREQRYAGD